MADAAITRATPQSAAATEAQGSALSSLDGLLNYLRRYSDIALAVGVICILMVLILPMPKWLLDMSLAMSITFSVLILMTALFISRPLDFSSFPTVLLIATMLRLSLNLASTRLILSHGHEGTGAAGHVIEAFGSFVTGGNFIIGAIVFAILVIVNFVVITKGSGRIAEVAARFSLDAMPGKQMAIDADLSAGLIDETEARARRRQIEDESSFFGAMDGAAKFVRGDAIAGLLITFINIVAGIIIGTVQEGLSLLEASKTYTVLTIGDGLVTQVPALIVSTAAGMLVSKAGVVGSADKAVFAQLGGYPSALAMAAALTAVLALLPGVPLLPFLTMSAISGLAAWHMRGRKTIEDARALQAMQAAPATAEEPVSAALRLDDIRLELGYALLGLVTPGEGPMLTDQIKGLRRQLANEMGFVMPAVRIQDNMQLPSNTYVLRVKEIEAGRGELYPAKLLVMDPRGEAIALPGDDTTEPTFGLPAKWVADSQREEASFRGYTVVDPPTVITTHLTEIMKDNMAELLSHSETQKLLDAVSREHQKLVADLIPAQTSVGGVQRVLKNLLSERVSIRDLSTILEGISEACGFSQNTQAITEHVRARLARQISDTATGPEGYVPLVTLSPEWEHAFIDSLAGQGDDKALAMAPSKLQEFIAKVRETFDRHALMGASPVLLTSPTTRPYVRSIVERFRPSTMVISQNEIHPKARIKTLGTI